ncbi:hypothetical protein BC826DRAFT_111099 [Russula brevipes]|nr:hypothetical protein BC826DRAFT_111099 [Russula brevipes]
MQSNSSKFNLKKPFAPSFLHHPPPRSLRPSLLASIPPYLNRSVRCSTLALVRSRSPSWPMKEASALMEKIPWFSPVAGLILQALTMREEVKQYKEWDVVMEKLERIARLVNDIGVACKRYNLEEKDLPDGLCETFQSLETELGGIKGALNQNKVIGGSRRCACARTCSRGSSSMIPSCRMCFKSFMPC